MDAKVIIKWDKNYGKECKIVHSTSLGEYETFIVEFEDGTSGNYHERELKIY